MILKSLKELQVMTLSGFLLKLGTLHIVVCCYDISSTMFECFHCTYLEIYLFPFFYLLIFNFLKQITGLGVKGIPQNFYAA